MSCQCGTKVTDCMFTNWMDWNSCSRPCGGGQQYRTRNVQTHASGAGVEFRVVRGCCHRYGVWRNWLLRAVAVVRSCLHYARIMASLALFSVHGRLNKIIGMRSHAAPQAYPHEGEEERRGEKETGRALYTALHTRLLGSFPPLRR